MKITIFIPGLILGGTERVVCNLANYMVSQGISVSILVLFHVSKPAYELDSKVQIVELLDDGPAKNRLRKLVNHIKSYHRLAKYTKSSDADKYLVMLPLPVIMLLSLKNITFKKPVIFSERSDPYHSFGASFVWRFLSRMVLKKVDGAVFQTKDAAEYYDDIIDCGYRVILNPISNDLVLESKKNTTYNPEEKAIIAVGRLSRVKNLSVLLRAFADISDRIPEYSLKLIGDGSELGQLTTLAIDLGIRDKVVFCGHKSMYSEIYHKGNIYVLCSEYEGLPNSLIEGMVLGLPCISTDCPSGGPRELIKNGYNGVLVKVNDQTELANEILRLASDKQKAEYLSNNAKAIIHEVNPQVIYERWIEYIETV
jgi:glycosyltransferase involved in cell wall biosynthesis